MKKLSIILSVLICFGSCKKKQETKEPVYDIVDYSDNLSSINYSISSLAGCGSTPSYTQVAKYEHHFPTLSSDGQNVIYVRCDSGSVSNIGQLWIYNFDYNVGQLLWNNVDKNFKPDYGSNGKVLFVGSDSSLYTIMARGVNQLEGIRGAVKGNAIWKRNSGQFCVGGSPLEIYDDHGPTVVDTTYFIKEPYVWNYDNIIYGCNAGGSFVSYNINTKQRAVLNTQTLKFVYYNKIVEKMYFMKDNGLGNADDLISYSISSGNFATENQFNDSFVLESGSSNPNGKVMSSVRYSIGASSNCNIQYRYDVILMNADGSGISKVNLP